MSHLVAQIHKLVLDKMEHKGLGCKSKEALKTVLREYEVHTQLIEQELEKCKNDHMTLRSDITKLIEENKILTQKLMAYDKTHFEVDNGLEEDKCENLKLQLTLALDEKCAIEFMWKSCLKELELAKEKLKEYESGQQLTHVRYKLNDVQRDYTEAIQILESKMSTLKVENEQLNAKNGLLENQLVQSVAKVEEITMRSLSMTNSIQDLTDREQECKSKFLFLEAKYLEVEKAYQADKVKFARIYEFERIEFELKEQLQSALRQRDELQVALERCQERMAELLRNAASDRSRIEEAVGLVEEAIRGRNEALTREASSMEEMVKIKLELNNLVGEAGKRVGEEVAAMRNQFQTLITSLREELQLVKQERDRKDKEAQQWQRECERLQNLLDEPKVFADPQTDDRQLLVEAYREVQFMEAECRELQLENAQLHHSLMLLQERYKKSSQEKVKLKRNLKRLQEHYQESQQELAAADERAVLINNQLQQANIEMTRLQRDAMLHGESGVNTQAKLNVGQILELYKNVDDSYKQMNDKWKNEMNTLTEKFQTKLKQLKKRTKCVQSTI